MVSEKAGMENPDKNQQEISADWEDAFQTEDFLISPDTSPESRPDERTGTTPENSIDRSKDRQTAPPRATRDKTASPTVLGRGKKRGGRSSLPFSLFESLGDNLLWNLLLRLPGGAGRGLSRLSPSTRGIALLLAAAFFFGGGTALVLIVGKAQEGKGRIVLEEKAAVQQEAKPSVPTGAEERHAGGAGAGETAAGLSQLSASQREYTGPDLHKWRFSSFMIDAGPDDAGKPGYVVIDLSLILRVEPGEDFPIDKEYAVRNMIFQFFSNRPPYELRRFSLARGEMKQKLLAWLNKEWPANPIESVLFNRYQLI